MLKVAFDKSYKHPLDENHRFPMIKYDLIPEQLLRENTCNHENFFSPSLLEDNLALLTHCEYYYKRFSSLLLTKKEIRPIGFPMSRELVYREKKIAKGTIECVDFSIKNGISMNIAGGTHHAFRDRGEAFCMLNDQAIAANYLLENNKVNKILIVDLDVHQGNGTASIFKENKNVFTFSMHSKSNYPAKKSISDCDVELKDNTEDKEYLNILKFHLNKLNKENFDFVFYIAGVDIHFNDRLGKLKISDDGIKKRDEIVTENFFSKRIPLCGVLGGGYNKNIDKLVELHSFLHQSCAKLI